MEMSERAVPKRVMDFLRKTEDNLVERIEYTLVDNFRAEIDGFELLGRLVLLMKDSKSVYQLEGSSPVI